MSVDVFEPVAATPLLAAADPIEELSGFFFEDIESGMTAAYARTIGPADVVMFAGISGDTNPMHLNEEYAARSMFEGTIAHGMLCSSFISTVLGTRLPGPGCVYISQNLKFKAPVRPGDTVKARATVIELKPESSRVMLETVCTVGDTVVIAGQAEVLVPRRNKQEA
ncbi:MAG: (R)-hydratase [Rhodospirillaceae bacterium]|nr:(R)-hydratase [Rhodospirillaceae bacterium]|tara:strand:+ start:1480 stop:1980 length:501 start_codon:yes stop_codon:yes gene_type:complete